MLYLVQQQERAKLQVQDKCVTLAEQLMQKEVSVCVCGTLAEERTPVSECV